MATPPAISSPAAGRALSATDPENLADVAGSDAPRVGFMVMAATKRLLSVPGIGLLTATALVAFVGEVNRFASGRRFASYLGLTPRERSSGNIRRVGSISKRGDTYIRMLLTHGARAVLRAAMVAARNEKKRDSLRARAVWRPDQMVRDMKAA